ncbi:nucleic acid-binding [Lecanosticta acicola]|uniref:Nucleic acid-binding n=1 Tax=Lecanosticta acicola TaxID=111012 RepID=A0AAI8Z972_9PEZI|nr:nucleic acid-binding [Lecanosticta acicola]
MSQRALALPIRTLSSPHRLPSQWICQRCLSTQTDTPTSPVSPAEQGVTAPSTYDPTLPFSQRGYPLNKTDFNLKKPLKQARIPEAHLRYSTSDLLHQNEKGQREKAIPHKKIVGVVVSAGKMQRTVRVRVAGQKWNKRIGKYYRSEENHLVHDPNSSLVQGDVVELHRLRVAKTVGHVVASIVSPFGAPVEARPPIPTPDERLAAYKAKRFDKQKRRELRVKAAEGDAEAIQQLKDMALDPGYGAEPGVGKKDNAQAKVGKQRNPTPGAILGEKGQKLPEGVLPGGKHATGKINERAQHNKGKAERFDRAAWDRLVEGNEQQEELDSQNLNSGAVLK